MKITPIRPARQEEHGAIVACVQQAYVGYIPRMGRQPVPMLADYYALIAQGVVYVLSDEEGIQGRHMQDGYRRVFLRKRLV